MAYVESYDDILFWRDALSEAAPHVQFEVVLPSRLTLGRGKKIALANRLGPHMIACVDADYDFLMQGATPTSEMVCRSPYVVHTFVYAIENLQCHAEVLDRVCVMATLNDRVIFDFRAFLTAFSRIVHPLLVWNVWAYRYGFFTQFSLTDLARTVEVREVQLYHPERMIDDLRRRVNRQIAALQRRFPQARATYKPLRDEMVRLGVTPETAYLYMRGHDLVDVVLGPILSAVCDVLRREREREITKLACHAVQQQNELAAYRHAVAPFEEMLRKHTAYHATPEFRRIVAAVRALFVDDPGAPPTSIRRRRGSFRRQMQSSRPRMWTLLSLLCVRRYIIRSRLPKARTRRSWPAHCHRPPRCRRCSSRARIGTRRWTDFVPCPQGYSPPSKRPARRKTANPLC